MDWKKKLAGKTAQKVGSGWENVIKEALLRAGFTIFRIQDGCKAVGAQGKQLVRVSQPFDFVAVKNGHSLFFDAKARSGSENLIPSWLEGRMVKKGSKMMMDSTMRQRIYLEAICKQGCMAGFVVLLRDTKEVRWIRADKWKDSIKESVSWGILGEPLQPRFSNDPLDGRKDTEG